MKVETPLAEYGVRKLLCFLPIRCFTFRHYSTLLFAANLINFDGDNSRGQYLLTGSANLRLHRRGGAWIWRRHLRCTDVMSGIKCSDPNA